MRERFIAISDTHLGENASFLNHDEGMEFFCEKLSEIAPNGVDELVLMGDITDQVLASEENYSERTKTFLGKLTDCINVERLIFLFGNHDLNLLRNFFCFGSRKRSMFWVHGLNTKNHTCGRDLRNILLPDGFNVDFYVANPIYVTQTESRTYIFHHGHHVKSMLINRWKWRLLKAMDGFQLDRKILGTELEFGKPAPWKADTLEQFEYATYPFITSFWCNDNDSDFPPEDENYQKYHEITRPFHRFIHSSKKAGFDPGGNSTDIIYSVNGDSDKEQKLEDSGKIKHLNFIRKHYIPAIDASSLVLLPNEKPISFVYGDTHDGGFAATETKIDWKQKAEWKKQKGKDKVNLNVFNTGAWIEYYKEKHPRCFVYRVDAEENEFLHQIKFTPDYLKRVNDATAVPQKPEMNPVLESNINYIFDI